MDHFDLKNAPSLDNLELVSARFVRHQFPMHFHDTYVIQLVDHGSDQFDCNNHGYTAGPGDLVIIRPHSIHSGVPFQCEQLKYRALYPNESLVREFTSHISPLNEGVFRVDRKLQRRFDRAFSKLLHTDRRPAETAFGDLICSLSDLGTSASKPMGPTHSLQVRNVLKYFAQHFDRPLLLDELATACQTKPIQLIRAFRREMGITPHQYLINFRVLNAKRLLQRSGFDLTQIALDSGFTDQSHMNRLFRKYFGITPGRYRDRCRAHGE